MEEWTKNKSNFNEGTLWSGGPQSSSTYNYGNKIDAWKKHPEIRTLIKKGQLDQADKLAQQYLTGEKPATTDGIAEFGEYGSSQPMGNPFISIRSNDTSFATLW